MEEKLYCKIHSNEYYENYCEECKELICPHCALSQKHFSHISKIKSLEEVIKQKIKGIDDFKNFSLYKTTELFQFIINYNSLFVPFDNSYIINSINDQFEKYIQKIIELKFEIINLFSKKFELMSNILQSTKKTVVETQNKLLAKIGGSNDNNNEYLNKLNMCLEKIRINKNPNEAMNFIGEYQNLINECFENNEDLNKKYNFYLAYKYLNDISFSFKDKFFDKLILPNFKNALSQTEELIKKLNIEEKKDYEDFNSKLKELNIETEINKKQNKIEKNKENKNNENEIKLNKEKDIDKKEQNDNNNIKDKNQENIEQNNNKKENENENEKEESKQKNEKKEEINEVGEKEKKKEKEKEKENIKENNNVNNQNKDEKDKSNENIKKENEKKENDKEKEREEFKKMLDNKNKQKKNEKNDHCNIEFEPPKIEGGKMTQEEINNLKEDEEEKFLKKGAETEDKEIGASSFDSKYVEKTELEIAKKIIDELDEDRLDIQYYEGIKFPEDDEKGGMLDNAYLEDNENKNEIKDNENKNEIKENEVKENINKNEKGKDEIKDIKEEEKKENKNNEKESKDKLNNNNNKPRESLNHLFGIKDNSSKKNEDKNKDKEKLKKNNTINSQKDKIEKHNPSFDLDQWVNIEAQPKNDNNKKNDKNKRKTVTKNPTSFSNVFGVKPENKNKEKDEKEKEKEKEIIYKEPSIPAPNNLESIEKLRKLYKIINSDGRNNSEYNSLFNSLTWEEKNYIEIIGLKSSDSTTFVYNQISDTIENMDTKIKFPSHQSYINVHPYVYLSGGKDNNKPINLIRRLRKINQFFKLEELGNLKEARSHHSTIYVKSMNSLIFISGSKTKTCEKFNLTKKQIESFPSVRNAREKCGTCLENDEILYIFLGFDKAKSKFETTIERINLNKSKSWEVLLIIGDQNLLKRQSMACIPFNMKNGKGIIITGGVGNLRNESDDTIYIDLEKNNVNKFNFLPFGASFTNPNFLPLTLGVEPKIIYNITNENKIISFNLENYSFSGNEYKEN